MAKNKCFYKGQEIERLPESALKEMSERLSVVVSAYFTAHPDEYAAYLESRRARERERVSTTA